MDTNYDEIAEGYRRAKQQPWRSFIESFTLLELCGDLGGKSVVDLACGEGFYSRLLRRRGAIRVVGVDLSEGMIGLALAEEQTRPLGIEYLVGDGRDLELPETFDLAIAAYLLNYARSRDELDAMCRAIARSLKPGGRFVAVNSNPDLDFARIPSFRAYGFEVKVEGEVREGTPFEWTFYLEDGPIHVENYHLDLQTHNHALEAAGFQEVRWHYPRLSPQGESDHGREYWEPLLSHAPVIFLECVR